MWGVWGGGHLLLTQALICLDLCPRPFGITTVATKCAANSKVNKVVIEVWFASSVVTDLQQLAARGLLSYQPEINECHDCAVGKT